jgi:hypothetical protein
MVPWQFGEALAARGRGRRSGIPAAVPFARASVPRSRPNERKKKAGNTDNSFSVAFPAFGFADTIRVHSTRQEVLQACKYHPDSRRTAVVLDDEEGVRHGRFPKTTNSYA